MTVKQPFNPQYGSNQVLTAAASSASASIDPNCKQLRVVNTGANKAYFRIYNSGDGSQNATTADFAIMPNMASTITKFQDHNAIAYISASGTTIEIMTGEGF